ncbi:hypothetical protein VNO78_04617 [Psophocarpus tetragonolobus]|uniref:Uncharacterized protein n=1 Tax=Psophocarpus tetragonolobus TaxID=3891 RepID=A0AAN9XWQ7_PSOTE
MSVAGRGIGKQREYQDGPPILFRIVGLAAMDEGYLSATIMCPQVPILFWFVAVDYSIWSLCLSYFFTEHTYQGSYALPTISVRI